MVILPSHRVMGILITLQNNYKYKICNLFNHKINPSNINPSEFPELEQIRICL
jgi:hypothetical protein